MSRLEKNPGNITVDMFLAICTLAGMTPDQVLRFTLPGPGPLEVSDPYRELRERRRLLEDYLRPWREKLARAAAEAEAADRTGSPSRLLAEPLAAAHRTIQQLDDILRTYGAKPLVAFLGRSDAGKSRMINALTGINMLPVEWQPTTSIRVYVKHTDDKPPWMDEDAWVFRKPDPGSPGWDFRRFADEDYCRAWKIDAGSSEVLERYATRRGSRTAARQAEAAVVYIDSPILRACDIIDLPGFGTGDREEDDVAAQRGREQADVIIYLSAANSFMHEYDILYLRELIRELGPLEARRPGLAPLSNLFIVASQAHIPAEDEVEHILDTGAERLYGQIPPDVWEARKKAAQGLGIEPEYTPAALRSRFFPYTLDNGPLRAAFEQALRKLLEEDLPPVWLERIDAAVRDARAAAVARCDARLRELTVILDQREAQRTRYEQQRQLEPAFRARLREERKTVEETIARLRNDGTAAFAAWYRRHVTVEAIEDIIRTRRYTRKDAQTFLPGNVNDMIYAFIQKRLQADAEELAGSVTAYLDVFEEGARNLVTIDLPAARVAFDARGAFAGGLASASVLGALALWAGSMGNLGGYILVAKGVSVLSSLGVSIAGGTAAAVSAVAALGGPATLALGLALTVGLAVKSIFGDQWQTRMARQLIKQMEKERVAERYQEVIAAFWDDTADAWRQAADAAEKAFGRELERIGRLLAEDNTDNLRAMLAEGRALRDFLGGIPWGVSLPPARPAGGDVNDVRTEP